MKFCRRILCLLISAVMLIGLVPAVMATEGENGEMITDGVSMGIGTSALQDGQSVLYGSNAAWIVLSPSMTTCDTQGVALLSKEIVDANIAFNKGGLDNAWANSDAKVWASEYATETFTASELAAIMDTTKAEEAGSYFGANWSKDALDAEKMFFLSAAEVQDYFGNSIEGLVAEADGAKDGWWLRSAYTDRGIYGGIVSDSGFVGAPHIAATWGARPAFNISADKIVLTSAAVGGKVSGSVGADALAAVEATSCDNWKLTVVDEAHSAFSATIGNGAALEQTVGYDSWVVPISYTGAVAGENEYVSVVICNQNGNAVYYGHIAQNSATGSVNVNMPAGLSGKYTMYVFAEQCNGDNQTDFGSKLYSAEIKIDDGMSEVKSWGLVLEGDIRVDFLLALEQSVLEDSESYVKITVDGISQTTKVSDLVLTDGYWKVGTNVAAAQMTDDIAIQVFTSTATGNEYLYSVRKYSDYILANNDDAATVDLVKAMLIYGGSAQDYFSYKLTNKADNDISLDVPEIPYTENLAAKKQGSSSNVKYYGSSLIHDHQTTLRFYFTSTDAAIAGVTFSASVDGKVIDSNMKVTKHNGMYFVEVTDIAPNHLCDEITISVDGLQVTYSPFYYIHRKYYNIASSDALRDLMHAMYGYYYYADAYLNK